jgi:DNA-binding transcriptional regulator YiaG
MNNDTVISFVDLKGTALVFVRAFESAVYKVELSQVAGQGKTWHCERFAGGEWSLHQLNFEDDAATFAEIEKAALQLAPHEFDWWEELLGQAPRPAKSERIRRLVTQIMHKFDMSQQSVAERVGVTRQNLSDYMQGRAAGSGVMLELALEALLARPHFGTAEEDKA